MSESHQAEAVPVTTGKRHKLWALSVLDAFALFPGLFTYGAMKSEGSNAQISIAIGII